MGRVGLGLLGVLEEVVMECVPSHHLREHTFTLTRGEAKDRLDGLLKKHKHVRYMWIPYEDTVVVVTNDVVEEGEENKVMEEPGDKRFAPLRDLLIRLTKGAEEPYTEDSLEGMGFGAIRDALIAIDPLGVDHMKVVNRAEAEFWKKSEGYRVKPSDELLQFDCGGQLSRFTLPTVRTGVQAAAPRSTFVSWKTCARRSRAT